MQNPVLVLEDDMMLSMMMEDMLNHIGLKHVEVASSIDEAMMKLNQTEFSYAFLDVNIGGATSVEVALSLKEMGVPFCFTTGVDRLSEHELVESSPFLQKPYSGEDLKSILIQAGFEI